MKIQLTSIRHSFEFDLGADQIHLVALAASDTHHYTIRPVSAAIVLDGQGLPLSMELVGPRQKVYGGGGDENTTGSVYYSGIDLHRLTNPVADAVLMAAAAQLAGGQ